ncbi:hypothetical protein EG329_003671 [Mollisiaceae sp. DMI_Dod_QoI]|nr:hypothetical protein EG329_003671 [Helotiales sp. DMI_Dod_QoI]
MASQGTYHMLPPQEDEERDSSPHDSLLHTTPLQNPNNTWSFTLTPIVVLRVLSIVLSLVAFIILVLDGGPPFIAVDIFLACIMIVHALMLVNYMVTHLVKVTVEVRQHSFALGNRKKPRVSRILDLLFAAALTLSLLIGNAVKPSWRGSGAWKAAVVLGYLVVLTQVLLAVPSLETKSLSVTIKLNDLQGKYIPDTKFPSQASTAMGSADTGAARRRTPEAEAPRQTAETLV